MSTTRRLASIIVIAVIALIGAVLTEHPAHAAATVTGTVSSSNGPVDSGVLAFFATCQDYYDGTYAAVNYFDGGVYSLTVPDGTYRVGIRPDNDNGAGASFHSAKPSCEQATLVTISGNTTLNLVTLPGSKVTGTVSTSNGPVASGNVYFYASCEEYEGGQYAASAYFLDGDAYSVTLADSTYLVWIEPWGSGAIDSWHSAKPTCEQADVVTVSGSTTQNLVATADKVTGTVSSSNGPVDSGDVYFFATCQDYKNLDYADNDYISGGAYSVTVADGTYRVLIQPDNGTGAAESWHSAKPTCEQADVVTVSGNTTQNLVAMADKVTGTVSSSNGPVDSGDVFFFATCQDYDYFNYADNDYISGGAYSVTVADGTYRVLIQPDNGTGALESWHSAKPTCEQADVVTVSGNTTQKLVALPGSDVTGTVSSSNGPVTEGWVSFYATCQDYNDGEDAGWADIQSSTYSVTVADGTYRVLIQPDYDTGAVRSWHNAKRTCGEATVVAVGGNTTQNLVALPGREVTGTVSSSNGPVDSGEVYFFATCQDYKNFDYADNGYFEEGDPYSVNVADGTYRVRIWPDEGTGALESWHSAKPTCEQADVVTVSGNATLDLVTMASSEVTGTVSSSNGPVTEGWVSFYATCQDYNEGEDAGSAHVQSSIYSATLADGAYRVLIQPEYGTGALESWHSAKRTCGEATVVAVGGNTTQNLVAMATGGSPPPTPSVSPSVSPSTPPPAGTQTVKKPPAKIKQGKTARLAKTSAQGARVTWKSTTKKVCSVTKSKVKGLKKGKCALKATAPAVGTFLAYWQKFTIRVK